MYVDRFAREEADSAGRESLRKRLMFLSLARAVFHRRLAERTKHRSRFVTMLPRFLSPFQEGLSLQSTRRPRSSKTFRTSG
jgi:hypothetical protein